MVSKDKQMRIWIKKQKALVLEAKDPVQRDYILMMWLGYLNGLRLTNIVTCQELNALYAKLQDFMTEIGAA